MGYYSHSKWRRYEEYETWLKEHTIYLASDEWKWRRQMVLERDNYLCQGCLTNRATQVHHLTYKHWRNELLFELVSVCDGCHDHEKATRIKQA